jgi:hypothetical protein
MFGAFAGIFCVAKIYTFKFIHSSYIIHSVICQFTRRVHITLGLRYLTDDLFQ